MPLCPKLRSLVWLVVEVSSAIYIPFFFCLTMEIFCTASFEVKINSQVVHSKLATNSFPDFDEVVQIVQDVGEGGAPRQVTKTKSAGCSIMWELCPWCIPIETDCFEKHSSNNDADSLKQSSSCQFLWTNFMNFSCPCAVSYITSAILLYQKEWRNTLILTNAYLW